MPCVSVVQFETSRDGRRVGVVQGAEVIDLTAAEPTVQRIVDAYPLAMRSSISLANWLTAIAARSPVRHSYGDLLSCRDPGDGPVLRPPLDHADPYRTLISGTGLTHLGSMQSRDQMHAAAEKLRATSVPEPPKTDSRKIFEWGLAEGRPAPGTRGVAPEWFYKGNGTILRGPGDPLEIPEFAPDGGEEPEIVGCYVIDIRGQPVRLGFALGNEWSDHATEKLNYLYLAPSKLRTCAVGPELVIGHDFQEIELACTISRAGRVLYDSGPLWSGEKHMCHSLANLEDHHFKYPQHRRPGDVHLYFFGTSQLSYGTRDWKFAGGDEIRITAAGFSAPLLNRVQRIKPAEEPVGVTVA